MDFVGPVLTVIVVSLVMSLLSRAGHNAPTVVEGGQELRFPGGILALGVGCVVISIAVAVVVPLSTVESRGSGAFIGIVSGFGAIGTLLAWVRIRLRVRWDAKVVHQTRLFGGERTIAWDDVRTVRYGYISQELTLSNESTRVKVGRMMKGFFTFVDAVETGLPSEMTAEPMEQLRKREAAR